MRYRFPLIPKYGIVLTPVIFASSQFLIMVYYWVFGGHAGDLTLTISRYVGLELWSSIFFAICNFAIAFLMLRYYFATWKKISMIWLLLSIIQTLSFIGLSICPHSSFIGGQTGEFISEMHVLMARIMFLAMFGMMFERLRENGVKNNVTTKVCLAFLGYSIIYIISYASNWDVLSNSVLIWESGYIYAFMGTLILSRPR